MYRSFFIPKRWYAICKCVYMKRKKIIPAILSLLIVAVAITADAQTRKGTITPFKKGSTTLNLGLGFGTDYKNDFRGNSTFGTKAAIEFGIWPAGPGTVSLGPEIGLTTANDDRYYRDDFRARTFVAAARSAWHYGWKVPGLDTYAGVSAGAGFYHYEYDDNHKRFDYNDVFPVVGGFVGVSYFFTPGFGVNAEAGFDITSIQGGLVFKLR